MSAAQYDTTSVKIQAKDQIFTLAASRMRFDGFMSVYTQEDDKEEENVLGGNLDENSVLEFRALIRNSILPSPLHITPKPVWCVPWKNWASDVPVPMRPPLLPLLPDAIVAKENKNLYVTELGEVVNRINEAVLPKHL